MSSFTIAKYLRISSEDDDLKQSEKLESNSIANQRDLLQDFICRSPELAGANIVEFHDDGFSGKNFDRPAVKELFEQVKQGKIQCIIVKDLSRFGRDYLAVGNYISRVFPFIGVRFIAVNDGFDSNRPADIDSLDTSFKTLLYDIYSRDLSRKVRGALRFKAERGDFIAPFAPFGYIKNAKDRKRLVIDSEAAKIVERIFKMVLGGKSTLQIAKILNSECVPTPMCYKRAAGCPRTDWKSVNEDNFWTHTAVTKILHDERYIGKNVYGKNVRKAVGDFHCIKMKKADWIVVDDMHDGIISQEEFERANACLREYTQREYVAGGNSPLNAKVRCGVCGHCMKRSRGKNPYYLCHTPRLTTAFSCPEERIPESDIMDAVLDALHIQAYYAVDTERIWQEKHKRRRQDTGVILKSLNTLKDTLNQLEQQLKELYEDFAFGEIDKAEYMTMKSAALEKRDVVAARIETLEAEIETIGADGSLNNRFVDAFTKYAEVEELTTEIVEDVLQEVVIYPNRTLDIVWNYRQDLQKLVLSAGVSEISVK